MKEGYRYSVCLYGDDLANEPQYYMDGKDARKAYRKLIADTLGRADFTDLDRYRRNNAFVELAIVDAEGEPIDAIEVFGFGKGGK